MIVVGIDPAPKKGLTCYVGTENSIRSFSVENASTYVNQLNNDYSDILICWDAPLSGPPCGVVNGNEQPKGGDFTIRKIERFFRSDFSSKSYPEEKYTAPKGISVLGYGSCPHWTISRALLGLPQIGKYDNINSIPFSPIFNNTPPRQGKHIVEVHPALAIWLWCFQEDLRPVCWEYKKDQEVQKDVWKILARKFSDMQICIDFTPKNDDEIDAIVAYALGTQWLKNNNTVILLGNQDSGAILLPKIKNLEIVFRDFCQQIARKYNV